jgi:gamma-glutamylcyclotransferase (GGCT)/AIG2-like uncharacterized protein YtfP
MDIDEIIEGLNRKKNISAIGSGGFKNTDLTEVEKTFLKTYYPERSLIVYGTLAPDAPNHSVVEHIKGSWKRGIVKGSLENKGWGADLGYDGFMHTSIKEQKEIEVVVLFSDELVANWQMLDDFEGSGYKRTLAKYELTNGQIGVGNIYAINEDEL